VIDDTGNIIAPHSTINGFKVALPAAEITQPAPDGPITFGGRIRLAGVSVEPVDSSLVARFDWQAIEQPAGDHTLFVHVVNEEGVIVGQADIRPRRGTYPTVIWDAGEIVPDEVTVSLPSDLPAGRYDVYIGWYTLPSGERLAALVDGEPTPDNRVWLADIALP
jgi:hypothetical protein